jgi:ABC-type oligopeptide transport system substrate-binding subunit
VVRRELSGRAAYSYPRRLDLERKRDDEQRPGAGRARDPEPPAQGLDAIVQADEPRAVARIRSADAVVADRQQQPAVARLELEALPASVYTDALFNGKRPMFYQTFGADSPDPAYALGVFYQSTSSNNWGGYKSGKADACLAKAGRPELTWDQRIEEHKRCAEIIANDAPWLWFAQPGFQVSTRSNVTGINWYAGEGVDWSKVGYTS